MGEQQADYRVPARFMLTSEASPHQALHDCSVRQSLEPHQINGGLKEAFHPNVIFEHSQLV